MKEVDVDSSSPNEIREVIRDFILQEFVSSDESQQLGDDTPLISGGILDSISTVRLVSYMEDRFTVRFNPEDVTVKNLDTIDRIVGTITEKLR